MSAVDAVDVDDVLADDVDAWVDDLLAIMSARYDTLCKVCLNFMSMNNLIPPERKVF